MKYIKVFVVMFFGLSLTVYAGQESRGRGMGAFHWIIVGEQLLRYTAAHKDRSIF